MENSFKIILGIEMTKSNTPSLFGLTYSNRDFSNKDAWGKNQFNSSFPASLCCYLKSKHYLVNYINIKQGHLVIEELLVDNLFGSASSNPLDSYFFAFEAQYLPYQRYVVNKLPRVDLVIQNKNKGEALQPLEIKLTALPDNTTCHEIEDLFGCELVVRPDSIVYLACSIIESLPNLSASFLDINWDDTSVVLENYSTICKKLFDILPQLENKEKPFLLHPIWKTQGKSTQLAEQCLDVFTWSNTAFIYFMLDSLRFTASVNKISRQFRAVCWLYKMLADFSKHGHFNAEKIINDLTYNTKNDKAFAVSGKITHRYMKCPRLSHPAISKYEIKQIILGGGQNLLSPERRFDAIIVNSPEIFE